MQLYSCPEECQCLQNEGNVPEDTLFPELKEIIEKVSLITLRGISIQDIQYTYILTIY